MSHDPDHTTPNEPPLDKSHDVAKKLVAHPKVADAKSKFDEAVAKNPQLRSLADKVHQRIRKHARK